MLRQLISQNQFEDWGMALLGVVIAMLVFHTLRRLAIKRLTRTAGGTRNLIDDFLLEILQATRLLLSVAVAIYLAAHFLTLPPALATFLDRVFIALMFLQAGFWAERAVSFWLQRRFGHHHGQEFTDTGSLAMTRSLLNFLGKVVVWALVLLLILDNIGLDVTALVASLGIGGIAVALAVQNILGDLFASLSITIDKPFVIGDFIIVDDIMGTVEHVGLKTTRLRSLSGEQIVLSNNDLLSSRIRNYKRMQERRATFSLGVTYDTPADRLAEVPGLIRQAIEAQARVRFDRAHFKSFGASSLDFEAVYFVLDADFNVYMDIQQGINLQLVREFAQRGIEFAFPSQTVYMKGGLQVSPPPDEPPGQPALSR